MIRIQGLRKFFGRQPVLRGVDLDVATGEVMIIIGRSGGGKSVLLKHLVGLLRPDAGAVLVDGTDITRATVRERGDLGLSHIPEDRHERGLVLEYSVADNLILGQQHRFS